MAGFPDPLTQERQKFNLSIFSFGGMFRITGHLETGQFSTGQFGSGQELKAGNLTPRVKNWQICTMTTERKIWYSVWTWTACPPLVVRWGVSWKLYVGAMLMLAVLLWNKTEWIWVSMAFWSIVEIWKKWEWFDKEDSTSLQRRFHFSRPYVSLKSSLLSFVTHILNPLDMLIDRVLVPSWFITYILQSSYEKRAAGQV